MEQESQGPTGRSVYHPRWYRERVSTYWWLWRWPYLKFVLREISSIFVAWYVLLTVLQIRAMLSGPRSYADFQEFLATPPVILFNAVSFVFVLIHTITWFNLAPRAMAVRVGGRRVPDILISAPNYAAWLAVSAGVAWMLLRG